MTMATTTLQPLHGSYLMPSLEHATVADAMHPGILSCEPDATLTEMARMMATHHVHCLAVMGISHEPPVSLVWGIITDLDLVHAGLRNGADTTARTLAEQPLITVDSHRPLREAAQLMLDHGVSHLIVTDVERLRPVGIVSTLDIAGVLAWGEA
jgi:CBS domain-containing protein